jgi:serine protease Do
VNGEEVTSMEEVVALINESAVGDSLTVTVDRDGESKDFDVTLGARPEDESSDSAEQPSEQQSPLPPGFGQ